MTNNINQLNLTQAKMGSCYIQDSEQRAKMQISGRTKKGTPGGHAFILPCAGPLYSFLALQTHSFAPQHTPGNVAIPTSELTC